MKRIFKRLLLSSIGLVVISSSIITISILSKNWKEFKEEANYRNLDLNNSVNKSFLNYFEQNFENLKLNDNKNIIFFDSKESKNYLSSVPEQKLFISIHFDDNSHNAKIIVKDKITQKIVQEQGFEMKFQNNFREIEIIRNDISYKKNELLKEINNIKKPTIAVASAFLLGVAVAATVAVVALVVVPIIEEAITNVVTTVYEGVKKWRDSDNSSSSNVEYKPNENSFSPIQNNISSKHNTKIKIDEATVVKEFAKTYKTLEHKKYYLTFLFWNEMLLFPTGLTLENAKNIVVNSGIKEPIKQKGKFQEFLTIESPKWRDFIIFIKEKKEKTKDFVDIYTPLYDDAKTLAKKSAEKLNSRSVYTGLQWEASESELHGNNKDKEFSHFHVEWKKKKLRKAIHILYGLPDNTLYDRKNKN